MNQQRRAGVRTLPSAEVGDAGGSEALSVVRGFNDALAQGDVAAMVEFLDPEVDWRAPASVPWGGTFRGRAGFRDFLAKVFDQPAEFRREILEYLAVGDRVVVLLRLMGRPTRDDTGFDIPEVHLWTVRDGKVVAFEGIFDTATVMRDLRLQPTD